MTTKHLQHIIDSGYADNIPAHYVVAEAERNGFIISEQLVRNAYTDMADQQWLDMNNGSYEPAINTIPF